MIESRRRLCNVVECKASAQDEDDVLKWKRSKRTRGGAQNIVKVAVGRTVLAMVTEKVLSRFGADGAIVHAKVHASHFALLSPDALPYTQRRN